MTRAAVGLSGSIVIHHRGALARERQGGCTGGGLFSMNLANEKKG